MLTHKKEHFNFYSFLFNPLSLLFLPPVEHRSIRFLNNHYAAFSINHSSVAVKLQKEEKTPNTVMKVVHILYLKNSGPERFYVFKNKSLVFI